MDANNNFKFYQISLANGFVGDMLNLLSLQIFNGKWNRDSH